MELSDRKAIVVGISGCSSSGKTTLARILRNIFPNSFILHEDDFYKPDQEIPVKAGGLADWDCPEAISIGDMQQALVYIRSHGTLPPNLTSKEDQNSVGSSPVSEAKIEAMKSKVHDWLQKGQPGHGPLRMGSGEVSQPVNICFLDGFLLYCLAMRPVMDLIDVRLFLRVSRARATERREARNGYVTLEGFWQDPPGYMEKVVWPNYVEAHEWLFEKGDVEGQPSIETLEANEILTQLDRGTDVDLETTLEWAVATLMGGE